MKNTVKNSFYYLLLIYSIFILLIALGIVSKYYIQFDIFALIIGLLGISIISKESEISDKKVNKKLHYSLLIIGILLIIILRTIPYIGNSIPLGYDAGIYKYGIEYGLTNMDNWVVQGGMEPGFLYLMEIFKIVFSTHTILIGILILFCALLGLSIYLVVKEFSNSKTALISLILYAFSIIQFKAFSMMYYKNIIALSLVLFSIYFIKRNEDSPSKLNLILSIIFGGFAGAVHRPTFYIFGLSYFIYSIISPFRAGIYNLKILRNNIISGIIIIILASLFYIGKFSQAITIMFEPVIQGFIQPGESPGTFINFFTFQYSSLFYLPLAIIGLFYFLRKKDINLIVIWAITNASIVYLQFFFYNRMIIFLDVVLIILASIGFSSIIKENKKLGSLIAIILIFSGGIFAFQESFDTKPLVNQNELNVISYLQSVEPGAYVLTTSSTYSPWVLGYSQRKTSAPGLFDYNLDDKASWTSFWSYESISEIKSFLDKYPKPLYIFIGEKQRDSLIKFPECFENKYSKSNNTVYFYRC